MSSSRRLKTLIRQLHTENVSSSLSLSEEMGDRGEKMLKDSNVSAIMYRSPTIWNAEQSDLAKFCSLEGKTIFIAGASRGIGKAIALRCAKDGANIVITGKTADPHPTLPGTVFTAAEECKKAGRGRGEAIGLVLDVRNEKSIKAAVDTAVERYGGIDVCISCASAIFPQRLGEMSTDRFDLMMEINSRGTVLVMKACMPYLEASAKRGRNPHVIVLSPPLCFSDAAVQKVNTNYFVAKGGMTLAAMYASMEFSKAGVGCNTLWPTGLVTTSALNHMFRNKPESLDMFMRKGRTPQCQADAAYAIATSNARNFTGNQCVDEDVLLKIDTNHDFSQYDYLKLGTTREERLKGILAS